MVGTQPNLLLAAQRAAGPGCHSNLDRPSGSKLPGEMESPQKLYSSPCTPCSRAEALAVHQSQGDGACSGLWHRKGAGNTEVSVLCPTLPLLKLGLRQEV